MMIRVVAFSLFFQLLCLHFYSYSIIKSVNQVKSCNSIGITLLKDGEEKTQGDFIQILFYLPAGCLATENITIKLLEVNSPTKNKDDYRLPISNQAIINQDENSVILLIPVVNDPEIEKLYETFTVKFSIDNPNSNYTFSSDNSIQFQILDDDNTPQNKVLSFKYDDVIVEGNSGKLKVNLPAGKSFSNSVTLTFVPEAVNFQAELNVDYSPFYITFSPGENFNEVDIEALTDILIEGDEIIRGRLVVTNPDDDNSGLFPSPSDLLEIKIKDVQNTDENRVILITPQVSPLREGNSLTLVFTLQEPYKLQNELTFDFQPSASVSHITHSDTEITMLPPDSKGFITITYPEDEIITAIQILHYVLRATDPHLGTFSFKINQKTVADLSFPALDNDGDLIIPNAFTPNGDGINDTWNITGIDNNRNYEVMVFNRYGSKVYESKSYPIPWNGNQGNMILPPGTYYYQITKRNEKTILAGYLTILY